MRVHVDVDVQVLCTCVKVSCVCENVVLCLCCGFGCLATQCCNIENVLYIRIMYFILVGTLYCIAVHLPMYTSGTLVDVCFNDNFLCIALSLLCLSHSSVQAFGGMEKPRTEVSVCAIYYICTVHTVTCLLCVTRRMILYSSLLLQCEVCADV